MARALLTTDTVLPASTPVRVVDLDGGPDGQSIALFSAASGGTSVPNPVTTTADGALPPTVYVEEGDYVLIGGGGGYGTGREFPATAAVAATSGTSVPTPGPGDAGKVVTVSGTEDGFELDAAGAGDLFSTNNLSDVANAGTARTNLGLGTAATHAHGDYDAAGAAAAAQAASQPLDADLTSIAALDSTTAGALATDGSGWVRKTYAQFKTALGLVKADVGLGNVDNTADSAKPVSTAQAAANALKMDKSANLSDVANAGTARTNLGLGTAATVNTGTASGDVPLLSTGGVLPIARLATGSPDGTKFVRDDGTLAAPAGGGGSSLAPGEGPVTSGLLAWTWDPVINVVSNAFPLGLGFIYLVRVEVPTSITVNTIRVGVGTAASPGVTGYVGIYDSAGNRLGTSAQQTTSLQSTGVKAIAMSSAVSITGGSGVYVYVAILVTNNAPLMAGVLNSTLGQLANGGSAAVPYRMNYYTTGSQTSLPSTLTVGNIAFAGSAIWAGLS